MNRRMSIRCPIILKIDFHSLIKNNFASVNVNSIVFGAVNGVSYGTVSISGIQFVQLFYYEKKKIEIDDLICAVNVA